MNRNTYSGSPAVKTACPNRDRKFPFRHSKTARVNPQHLPKRAAKELCTPTGTLCRAHLGRDAFHPRPTPFRRDQINKARTFLRAQKALSLKSPIFPSPQSSQSFALFAFFVVNPVLKSAIRNPQSAIRN